MSIRQIIQEVPVGALLGIILVCGLLAAGAFTTGYSREAEFVGGRKLDVGVGWVSLTVAILSILLMVIR